MLEGKNTLVTGGSRGIGRGIALEYARQGANVAITYINEPEQVEALSQEVRALGVEFLAYNVDATDFPATEAMINDMVEKWGRIDTVVNNAGITMDTLMLRMTEEQFDRVMQVNLYSIFYMTKAIMRQMLKQRAGSIVNISSIVGVTGNAGQANYAASKAGMIGFTKSIAKEIGSRGIRANVVAPGFIQTEMTAKLPEAELKAWLESIPLKRAGQVQDIADICTFLASDMSTYITGQVLHVNGGMYM